jgi:hypothetical protein
MAKIHNEVQKEQLALHLASGGGADRAGAHGISERAASARPRAERHDRHGRSEPVAEIDGVAP